jgi:hypothetical protein
MSTELLPLDAPSVPALRRDALAPDLALLVERVLTDPNADVSKLSALLDVNERILDRAAKSAFDSAYARMQPELPEIDERGAIRKRDGTVQSRYARYEDIQSAVRPVLTRHGFSMRHRTEWPADRVGVIRIVGILSHAEGHSEESAFEAPADKSDFRSDVQSQGSTISYGKRYTTCDLLNIITRGQDTDGQQKAQAPDGFEDWWIDMQATAQSGITALEAAWAKTPKDRKEFTLNHRKADWAALKQSAAKVAK